MGAVSTPHIALLGCGHMGGAILKAWLTRLPSTYRYTIISPSRENVDHFLNQSSVQWIAAGDSLPSHPTAFLVAVKPQQLTEALMPYTDLEDCLYLTIAAGKPISVYESLLGNQAPLVRLMPNLAATVEESMTAAYTNSALSPEDLEFTNTLVQVFGKVIWLEDESLFHGVTALSASGPAYVFLLVEALAEAGQSQGLSKELSETLAVQTLIGSGALLKASPHISAATLRHQVTSRGGTTEAALSVLLREKDCNFKTLIAEAIQKAAHRSEELEKV